MNIIHIVPASQQSLVMNQESNMFLTHLVERNPGYARMAKEYSGYKILDNSLIELGSAVSITRLHGAAEKIGADEIILPDVFRDKHATLVQVGKAIRDIYILGPKYRLMAVAQGSTEKDFIDCFKMLEGMPEIHTIGIPKVTTKLHPKGRAGFEHLWQNTEKQIHFLGVWYSFSELLSLKNPRKIRSVDTCMLAYLNHHKDKNPFGVRPDGFTIDLETTTIDEGRFKECQKSLHALLHQTYQWIET